MTAPRTPADPTWELAEPLREPTESIAIVEDPQGYIDAPSAPKLQPPRINEVLGSLRFAAEAPSYSRNLPELREYPPVTLAPEQGGAASPANPGVDFGASRFPAPVARPITNLLVEPSPSELAAAELVAAEAQQAAAVVAAEQSVQLEEAHIRAIIAQLSLRDTAKEALRARMLDFGSRARQRSAYELVFIMLGFAVMVLVTTPALVPLVNAIRGHGS